MTNASGDFVWYELMTTDVAAAKVFYTKVVGWNTIEMPTAGMAYTLWQAGDTGVGGMMALSPDMSSAGMKPCWVGYIYVEDVDGATDKLKKLGGKIYREPADIPTVGRFSVVSDRQGAGFQLFKPTSTASRPKQNGPGHIGWHELHTTDWPNALEFYSGMFGWSKGDSIDMGPMGIYQLFKIDDVAVGGMMNSPVAASQCFWLYYFNVGDIDAAATRVTENGGRVMQGPHQVPGGGWIIQGTDPQGAWFALLGSKN